MAALGRLRIDEHAKIGQLTMKVRTPSVGQTIVFCGLPGCAAEGRSVPRDSYRCRWEQEPFLTAFRRYAGKIRKLVAK